MFAAILIKKIKNGEEIEMSVSSLRVDSFTPEVVQTLVDAGQKEFNTCNRSR